MTKDVTRFFEMVYNDPELQGSLNSALCLAAPALVVEMAKAKGCQFSADDLKQMIGTGGAQDAPDAQDASGKRELTSQEVSEVAGGWGFAGFGGFNNNWGGGGIFGSRSPFLNFWNKVLFRNIGINIHPIKGPSWVNLMAYRKAGSAAAPASTRSLTELHNQLATEPVKE